MGKVLTNIVFPFVLGISLVLGCGQNKEEAKNNLQNLLDKGVYHSIKFLGEGVYVGKIGGTQELIDKNGKALPLLKGQNTKRTKEGHMISMGSCDYYFNKNMRLVKVGLPCDILDYKEDIFEQMHDEP